MRAIDRFLNNITMYRLVVYALSLYAVLGIGFAFAGRISPTPTELIISLFLLIGSAYVTDRWFSKLFGVPTNMESSLITAMILFLIVHPADSLAGGLALALAGSVSSASKFLLAWNGKHIFNPAAFAAALVSLAGLQATTWWIGSSVFWPVTLLVGLAIVRKIRRMPLFVTFAGTTIVLELLQFVGSGSLWTDMKHALIASPFIFLATIMLTEPATMPPRRNLQIIFAAIVAVFYVYAWKIGPVSIHPEVALLIGNVLAYIVSPKSRVRLQLKEVQKLSERVSNYVFQPDRRFNFMPGQYMEWTLAGVPYDSRGNRRTFTIASSPTENTVQVGLKFYEPASTYKAAFERLQPGDIVYASQLAGNFTIDQNKHEKRAFIAGGIGITPFRSMVQYIADKNIVADIVLIYAVSDPQEFAYMDVFTQAAEHGVRVVPIVTRATRTQGNFALSKLDQVLIKSAIPDYSERMFYVSGPDVMVNGVKDTLHDLGVHQTHVKTDHFSGY
jgi:ferredoxin-NADP reductase/Na+-translocating ferredoxin:NAD+ oxidoreductase RnfD subunit